MIEAARLSEDKRLPDSMKPQANICRQCRTTSGLSRANTSSFRVYKDFDAVFLSIQGLLLPSISSSVLSHTRDYYSDV